jgi:predicted metal-dependent enzyme (double-stranded beta helix superfamily)
MTAFIKDVERLVLADEQDAHQVALGVQERLQALLCQPGLLAPACREPDPDHYRSHLLAVSPSRSFSVVSLVWLPGQITPIHDHISWCVVGVLEGLESEKRYALRQGPGGDRWLAPLEESALRPGHTSALVPPAENIHQVRNAGDRLAISLHVYGADLEVWGNSINQCFDAVPVRAGDLSGECVPWRRSRTPSV